MTDIEEHWKLYLSASNNMNYYNFTKQTTHKCILQSRPDPNEKIWYGKKIPYHQSYLRVPYRMFETEKEIWLYSILSYHFCTIIYVCVNVYMYVACTQKNRYQFSMRYLWNVISSFYLLLLLLECMQARNSVEETQRTKR